RPERAQPRGPADIRAPARGAAPDPRRPGSAPGHARARDALLRASTESLPGPDRGGAAAMTETAAPTSSTRETLADVYVVDADVHIHEDPAALAEYAEPPWDVALREIAKVDERYLDLQSRGGRRSEEH